MTMSTTTMAEPSWKTYPNAYQLVCDQLHKLEESIDVLRQLGQRMLMETGTRLLDWTDRVAVNAEIGQLLESGFESSDVSGSHCYRHPKAQLPVVVSGYGKDFIALKVESVIDFLEAHQLDSTHQILGAAGASIRRCCIFCDSSAEVWIVERHGNIGWQNEDVAKTDLERLHAHSERFRTRRRAFEDRAEGFRHARRLIEDSIQEVGRDRTADLFFAAERGYWQHRNDAGMIQRMRQDRLGLGWANHDHHTYRSSRAHFADLIGILELLGMECREKFYAGKEAGWGAQVMEHPTCGIVVFADVDLGAEEIVQDFAHQTLPPRDVLGTVGLWCALHGEAFLEAGMHHLECQFDFDAARQQLETQGILSMKPFTDLYHLQQAFTVGQRWSVNPSKVILAQNMGWITEEQAKRFIAEGAIGSHLEILQRRDGYKGFNPKGISEIITNTDPRIASVR